MGLSTLLLGAAMAVLASIGAGLLAAMVMLERPSGLSPAPARAPRRRPRPRCR